MPVRFLALIVSLAAGAASLMAAETPAPTGMVILTVGGAIANSNRPPSDAKADEFLAFHGISFIKGFAFDRPMLEALPQARLTMQPPEVSKPATFAGPLLRAVLAEAGAGSGTIAVHGMDGYATELTAEQIAQSGWILALTKDGTPLGIGQQGPLWLLNAPPEDRAPTREEQERWVWGVFYIEVEE